MNSEKLQMRALAAPKGLVSRFAVCSLGLLSVVVVASVAASSWFFGYNYFAL